MKRRTLGRTEVNRKVERAAGGGESQVAHPRVQDRLTEELTQKREGPDGWEWGP